MTKRRSKGDGALYWSEARQRWIAEATIGYTPAGKRIYRRGSGRTKTEAKAELKEVIRDHDDGLAIAPHGYTVADAVTDWLWPVVLAVGVVLALGVGAFHLGRYFEWW